MGKYDIVIIGGGPAGLTAAIYGARARLKTLVINKGPIGGLAHTTREIVNYPGYGQTTGPKLMKDFKKHAEDFGAEFIKDEVVLVDFSQEEKIIKTKKGKEFTSKAVILACGSKPRLLNIPGETKLRGSGVAYCATCDAEFFEGEDVVVIGSGDQAIEEGMYITKFANKVTTIVLHDEGALDCNKLSAEKAFANEKMSFIWNSTVEEVLGKTNVEGIKIKNIKTGESSELACQGVFFFVGMIPSTGFLQDSGVEMDQRGYIPVNELMETNVEGVYAVGDNRVKYLRQVVSAAGDGATAAVAAERYVEEINDFKANVLESEKSIILSFFNPMVEESLSFNTVLEKAVSESGDRYKIVKADISRKKTLAEKYGIKAAPAGVVLDKGAVIKQLDCSMDIKILNAQLAR
ncbi:thioredoxin reductase (NADPH) [Desulfotomaculum arcticum]|uniref:Thioredoxin reductase n=1 Tax=Desulfotruncus arcticus DSM 17038 TaxID=1121424 RepID=A0A1I2TIY0_9FIRM|nr:thioredoxin-disulfide reductase [Desulfotruncus arcticus]SFG63327.1 thioredoxin reductase (NADPH) [Desulfotomaculum arcticum] [Desulfotruncus arcticus DSM 17038]